MSIVKRNLVANLAGTAWAGLVPLALVPLYIRLLGIEAYALIGFQALLQPMIMLLDFGLGTTVNRELARLSATPQEVERSRAIVRTAEVMYWAIATGVAAVLFVAAPFLARDWFTAHAISARTMTTVLRLMAVSVAIRFPYGLYSSGLFGMQRHVVLNVVLAASVAVRAAGAVILLLFVARDVQLLFVWEVIAAALQTLLAAVMLHKILPGPAGARFDFASLRHAVVFARGVAIIGILAAITTQVDKLTVSKLLPLAIFGYYTLSATVASAVGTAVTPVQITVFPRFSQLVAMHDHDGLAVTYHRAAQTVSIILLPLTAVATLFSREIVVMWTGDATLAANTRWLIVLLIAGAAMNALMHVPYVLQLANGWTTPALAMNVAGAVIMPLLTIALVRGNGAIGAATAWVILHGSFLVAGIFATHHWLLRGHLASWVLRDVAVPGTAAFAVCAIARPFIATSSRIGIFASLAVAGLLSMGTAALATPVVREWIAERRTAAAQG